MVGSFFVRPGMAVTRRWHSAVGLSSRNHEVWGDPECEGCFVSYL